MRKRRARRASETADSGGSTTWVYAEKGTEDGARASEWSCLGTIELFARP